MIITRRIFNEPPNLMASEHVSGPFRASDGLWDVYADGYLRSRHETQAEALKHITHNTGN